jgi:predicted amidohydrolase
MRLTSDVDVDGHPTGTRTRGTTIRVAGAQMAVGSDPQENAARVIAAVRRSAAAGVDLLLTPEGSVSGYHTDPDFPAQAIRDAVEAIRGEASRLAVALALGTCYVEADGHRYNQIRFYDRAGSLAGVHSKILLCRRARGKTTTNRRWDGGVIGEASAPGRDELGVFAAGRLEPVLLDGMLLGGLVCNDLWANPECTQMDDPHLLQRLAEQGAKLVLHAVNSGHASGDELRLHRSFHEANLRMRTRSAGVFLVTVDAADADGRRSAMAPSGVLNPSGNWLVRSRFVGEELFFADINLRPPAGADTSAGQPKAKTTILN